MFKSLKRIEALMTEFIQIEKRVEEIVHRREIKYLLREAAMDVPWKCPFVDCKVEPYHLHTLPAPPNSGGSEHG